MVIHPIFVYNQEVLDQLDRLSNLSALRELDDGMWVKPKRKKYLVDAGLIKAILPLNNDKWEITTEGRALLKTSDFEISGPAFFIKPRKPAKTKEEISKACSDVMTRYWARRRSLDL